MCKNRKRIFWKTMDKNVSKHKENKENVQKHIKRKKKEKQKKQKNKF